MEKFQDSVYCVSINDYKTASYTFIILFFIITIVFFCYAGYYMNSDSNINLYIVFLIIGVIFLFLFIIAILSQVISYKFKGN